MTFRSHFFINYFQERINYGLELWRQGTVQYYPKLLSLGIIPGIIPDIPILSKTPGIFVAIQRINIVPSYYPLV